jgi:hypothetical protein
MYSGRYVRRFAELSAPRFTFWTNAVLRNVRLGENLKSRRSCSLNAKLQKQPPGGTSLMLQPKPENAKASLSVNSDGHGQLSN